MLIPVCCGLIVVCFFILYLGLREAAEDGRRERRYKEQAQRDLEEERDKWFFDTRF